MLPIPPLASAAFAASQVQKQSEANADQIRRVQSRKKNTAASGDEYVHTVESSEELQPIHDEDPKQQQGRKKQSKHRGQDKPDDDRPRLDLTA